MKQPRYGVWAWERSYLSDGVTASLCDLVYVGTKHACEKYAARFAPFQDGPEENYGEPIFEGVTVGLLEPDEFGIFPADGVQR